MAKRGRPEKYYTVYSSSTDKIIACGTARECAEQMGIGYPTFLSAVSKCKAGKQKNYVFIVEDSPYDEEMEG